MIGLSGGIDSTLVALVAVDALGPERVTCVSMPSRYSSAGTKDDARALAQSLGVEFLEIAIADAMGVYDGLLAGRFEGREPDITEENLQARIRGNLLMALSNKFGWLVLTTGNKSEISVGYSTLYGDMAGGFAVIKDVPKTLVYRLVDFRNGQDPEHPVPRSIIDRPPSAELRPDQKDQDSLPDYDTLDRILEAYVEEDADREQLIAAGLPEEAVDRVLALVDRTEYKRRQAPPGIKITPRAFGRDRRMPITNRYRGAGLRPCAGRRRGRLAVTLTWATAGHVRAGERCRLLEWHLRRGIRGLGATRPGLAGCAGASTSHPAAVDVRRRYRTRRSCGRGRTGGPRRR